MVKLSLIRKDEAAQLEKLREIHREIYRDKWGPPLFQSWDAFTSLADMMKTYLAPAYKTIDLDRVETMSFSEWQSLSLSKPVIYDGFVWTAEIVSGDYYVSEGFAAYTLRLKREIE